MGVSPDQIATWKAGGGGGEEGGYRDTSKLVLFLN